MRWRSICRFRLSFGRRHLWFRRCTMERGRERNRCVLLPLRVRSSTLQPYPHTLVSFISFSSLTKSTWVLVSRAISRLTIFHVCLELAQEKLEKAHACSSPHSDPRSPAPPPACRFERDNNLRCDDIHVLSISLLEREQNNIPMLSLFPSLCPLLLATFKLDP